MARPAVHQGQNLAGEYLGSAVFTVDTRYRVLPGFQRKRSTAATQ